MTTAIDLHLLTQAVYNRIKIDAQGSSVRSALGDGASSVIHAEKLRTSKPSRPFVALRGGAMTGASRDVRIPVFTWWIYDDREAGYYRINNLISLIEAAYMAARIDLSTVVIDRIEVSNIGSETIDNELQLLVRSLQLAAYVL